MNLTIATWNLRLPAATPNLRNDALLAEIQAINADIWVLTETNESIRLPGYCSLATPVTSRRNQGVRTTMLWVREDWAAQEVPVFTDLPEREEPARTCPSYTVSSRDTAPAVCAHVETPHGAVLVYGTVITYFGDRGPQGDAPDHREQRRAIVAHHRDWQRLRAAYPEMPFIVAGDFDATCDARNYPAGETCDALRDAIAVNNLVCLSKDKWIDHICVSAEHHKASADNVFDPTYFSPWEKKEVRLSDHHGVVARIEIDMNYDRYGIPTGL